MYSENSWNRVKKWTKMIYMGVKRKSDAIFASSEKNYTFPPWFNLFLLILHRVYLLWNSASYCKNLAFSVLAYIFCFYKRGFSLYLFGIWQLPRHYWPSTFVVGKKKNYSSHISLNQCILGWIKFFDWVASGGMC